MSIEVTLRPQVPVLNSPTEATLRPFLFTKGTMAQDGYVAATQVAELGEYPIIHELTPERALALRVLQNRAFFGVRATEEAALKLIRTWEETGPAEEAKLNIAIESSYGTTPQALDAIRWWRDQPFVNQIMSGESSCPKRQLL